MLHIQSPTSLNFKVHGRQPELVTPSKPTPREFKPLSDIDNLNSVRLQVPIIQFFPANPSMNGVDPVKVIKKAVSDTLVFYYPFAGRLREDSLRKLMVECTGEGILFTEADADVTLDQFGYPPVPPIPCLDQLLFDVPGSDEILNCPLFLIQVTRMRCGGFIFSLRCNHTMCDGAGLVQFIAAIGEMARGAASPSVLPKWERHILTFKNPIQEEHNNGVDLMPPEHDLCYRTFFFMSREVSALRRCVPPHLRNSSSFDLVTAAVWKCRVAALQPNPREEMSLVLAINLRGKLNLRIPAGYYGNALVLSAAKATAKEITENPLSYALEIVRNTKNKVTEDDYLRSATDSKLSMRNLSMTDMRYAGYEEVDFGWGQSVFSGLPFCGPVFGCHYRFENENGETGIMLPLCLPTKAMERFVKELNYMFRDQPSSGGDDHEDAIKSKL